LLSENVNPTLEKKKEYFNHMQENVSRMGELVDELLIVSRIEQGSFPVNKKESSIVNLLKETVSRSSVSAEASKIGVNVSIEENLPVFFFDPSLLKLVMENLFDNSIRYTQHGGRVKIRMEKKGNNIYFEIKDSGVGIPKEEQKFIFQKFFRAENPLKEKTKGSGLGLYIAKKIIERLNGKIWFDSVCGVGTTFYFTLPIK
jgi:signal transduction histidine kinase